MPTVRTKTTYLQMLDRPQDDTVAPLDRVSVAHFAQPTVDQYLVWYRRVGDQWDWVDRVLMDRNKLAAILAHELVDCYTLQVDDEPAGFCELDRRVDGEIEFAYFGLFPEFIGRGLGKYFLRTMVLHAWEFRPARVWLHTCDLDHPAALSNYIKAGFQVYDEKYIDQVLPAR